MTRVAVHGAAGQMGATVCRAVAAAPDLVLVAAVDPRAAGTPLSTLVPGGDSGRAVLGGLVDLDPSDVDVLVDFSRADAAVPALEWCAAARVAAVSGTTGIDAPALERIRAMFDVPGGPGCVIAANFSISAVLAIRLAEIAAPHLDAVEIVELHHSAKRDAPSGTALETARRIAASRRAAGLIPIADATADEVLAAARGALADGGIRVHSVRLPGLVAHEEIIFGAIGQTLTIRQDSYDRTSFMPGVLASIRAVTGVSGLVTGLDAVLGI
ncbi:MAG TPA: 4-hydroxy-tetrahydrodipicolinate reductase [Acidimicrobiales bacterium]|nr:4-hydroxy-tetrahydrodipicolinate reductase [Acidimicrobiales bacterium]